MFIILFWLGALIALGYAAIYQSSFTYDYRVYFSPENPELVAYDELEAQYTSDDNILLVIQVPGGSIFVPENLALLEQLTEEAWQVPHAQRVDSLINFQNTESIDGVLHVNDLVPDAGALDAKGREQVQKVALSDPSLLGRLVSPDGQTAAIFITLNFPGEDHQLHIPQSVEHVRHMVQEAEAARPELEFAVSGTAVINYVLDEMTLRDLQTLLPYVYVTLLLLLVILVRSVAGTLATALVITVAGVGAMGFAALSGIALTTASAGAPTIILTLAVADSVHFLASARDARLQGMSNYDALAESMRINFEPIMLTSLTTLIGFLSLNFSEAPPFRDLGNITAVGVLLAWGASLTLLPAVLSYLPWGKRPASRLEIRFSGRYADFVVSNRTRILVYSGLVALALIALAPTNTLDDQVVDWFGEDTEIRRDTDFITEHLIGPYRVEFSVRAPDEGGIADPRYLADLEKFRAWLAAHPKVAHVDAFSHVLKRVNRDFHDGDNAYYRLPQDRELAAQYILLYELSLPYGLDLNSQVTIDKSATRLTATLGEITSFETRHFKEEADAWAHRNLEYASVREGTGTAVMFAYVARRTIESMFFGTALAFVLISLTLVVALRSVKLGLISILPNVLPVMVTFGVWAIFVGEIGVVASGIVAMTLGLVVDDTVHFLSKYQRARVEHCLNAHDGIRFVFEHVGRALVTTTLVLIAGFSVLILSDFLINWQMGLLVVMTIAIALVLDFLLLPALLMWLDRDPECRCRTCEPIEDGEEPVSNGPVSRKGIAGDS